MKRNCQCEARLVAELSGKVVIARCGDCGAWAGPVTPAVAALYRRAVEGGRRYGHHVVFTVPEQPKLRDEAQVQLDPIDGRPVRPAPRVRVGRRLEAQLSLGFALGLLDK
jgi:hypothetical protein